MQAEHRENSMRDVREVLYARSPDRRRDNEKLFGEESELAGQGVRQFAVEFDRDRG